MGRTCGVGVILLLALGVFPAALQAQGFTAGRPVEAAERGFHLEQNYPNPVSSSTRIPFYLGEELFESGEPVVVTIRIYNVLQQLVAVPTARTSALGGEVEALPYTSSGWHEAEWDATDRTGRAVASGVYYLQLVVNGRSSVRKLVVSR